MANAGRLLAILAILVIVLLVALLVGPFVQKCYTDVPGASGLTCRWAWE